MVLLTACAPATPETVARSDVYHDVYWYAARQCEKRFGTLTVTRVGQTGDVSLDAKAESRSELAAFRQCYRTTIGERVERRRLTGLSLPEAFNLDPEVDID